MELTKITQEIYDASKRLEDGAKLIFKYAKDSAQAEKEYREKFAQVAIRLKDEGKPATMIENLVRGELSELRFKRDLAELTYKSCIESLKAQESQINALQSILKYQSEV